MKTVTTAIVTALCIMLAGGCLYAGAPAGDRTTNRDALVKRGEFLVSFGGCHDCHSPKVMTPRGPEPDPARLLSGHPAAAILPAFDEQIVAEGKLVLFTGDLTACAGPWGMTYAANLTPDDQTGIGLWTEDVFIQAMRTGKHMGAGRPILPPMPWQNLNTLPDDDLKAIFAYLKSLPPVKNPVPAPSSFEVGGSR